MQQGYQYNLLAEKMEKRNPAETSVRSRLYDAGDALIASLLAGFGPLFTRCARCSLSSRLVFSLSRDMQLTTGPVTSTVLTTLERRQETVSLGPSARPLHLSLDDGLLT